MFLLQNCENMCWREDFSRRGRAGICLLQKFEPRFDMWLRLGHIAIKVVYVYVNMVRACPGAAVAQSLGSLSATSGLLPVGLPLFKWAPSKPFVSTSEKHS